MILIVASRVDEAAPRLARVFRERPARVLTPLDLSREGWCVFPGQPSADVVVADGEAFDSRRISGVVCMLPRVFPRELVHIEPEDRAYVADEMTAFLIFWLSTLACPKLNAPTAGCLSGPSWGAEHWLAAAASAGLPITACRRSTGQPDTRPPASRRTVTVVGNRALGDEDIVLRRQAMALAARAGVDLLDVSFTDTAAGPRFFGADPFPDLTTAGAADAVLAFFDERVRS